MQGDGVKMKKSKKAIKREALKRIVSHPLINNVLECGCGNYSTPYIRYILKEKNKGFCLSLEDYEVYHNCIKAKYPDDKYGRIQLSKCVFDNKGLHYGYKLTDKYDFAYIDGPGFALILDPKTKEWVSPSPQILKRLSNKEVWLNPECPKGAKGTAWMAQYIIPHLNKDGIIMVDSRKGAMIHFYQKHSEEFEFLGIGGLIGDKFYKKIIKPRHKDHVTFKPTSVTLMYRKTSKNAKRIIDETGIVAEAKRIRGEK